MKRITLLLTLFCLTVVGVPAMFGTTLYTNGGPTAVSDFWDISLGASTSDTFACAATCTITGLTFYGTTPTYSPGATLGFSVTSGENFGIGYGSGLTILPVTVPCNGIGQCVYTVPISGILALSPGTYWLNLTEGPPDLAWFESFGPSEASHTSANGSTIFNIPSEAFTLTGNQVPEPGSFLMLGTGILGLAGVLRRKLKL
jgi:PEP-CTERM motif